MLKMEGIQTLKGSWPWPWPSIRPYGIPSCITLRPLPIYQISFKLKKLFVDGRTYGRTDGRTDISPLYIIRSTSKSRPNKMHNALLIITGKFSDRLTNASKQFNSIRNLSHKSRKTAVIRVGLLTSFRERAVRFDVTKIIDSAETSCRYGSQRRTHQQLAKLNYIARYHSRAGTAVHH